MFRNRIILVLGVISLLLVTLAVSKPFSNSSPATVVGANDFYQRHPDWTRTKNVESAVIPVVDRSDRSDYALRHPELKEPATTNFSAQHIQREYVLGERYGATPQKYAQEKTLREYWLGERYGQTQNALFTTGVNDCFSVPVGEIACRNQSQTLVP